MYARRRRTVLLLVLLLVATTALVVSRMVGGAESPPTSAGKLPTSADDTRPVTGAPPAAAAKGGRAPTPDSSKQPDATPQPREPNRPRTTPAPPPFSYAAKPGPVLGTAGLLRRFRVGVQDGIGHRSVDFAAQIDRILGDPRSWIAAGQFRLQRVTAGSAAEFTVFLASAATSELMCAAGGLRTAGYTSCRLAGQVIINVDRWERAVPDYGAPLATYQAYAVNHEIGHQLGHGHEACPGPGRPAPVMQQQTYGLNGCTANAWPYLGGRRYAGQQAA